MARRLIVLFVATLLAGTAGAERVAVPSYFYPGPLWTELEGGAPTVGLAIINPNSGPGPTADPNYAAQVTHTRAAGITVIAYVYTSYGARSAAAVEADIDAYYAQYPDLDGIFIDEVSSDCRLIPYYSALDVYVKAKGGAGVTVLNPGNPVPECHATAGDILLTFEGSYATYLGFTPSGWETGYADTKFWHLVYDATAAEMPNAVALATSRHAGWVYVTDDRLPNPWDTLPPYWTSELAEVRGNAGECRPMTRAHVTVGRLDTPTGDDTLGLTGDVVFPSLPSIDPVATGVRLVVHDTATTILDVTLPAGAFADPPGAGWKTGSRGTRWTFAAPSGAAPGGIVKALVTNRSSSVPGLYRLKVVGRAGSYPVDGSRLPLSMEISLDPTATDGPCGNATFPPPDAGCSVNASGSRVTCR